MRHPFLRRFAPVALIALCSLLVSAVPAGATTYSIKAKRVHRGTIVFELKKLHAVKISSARLVAGHRRARRLSVTRIRRAARQGQLRVRLPRTWRHRTRARTRLAVVARAPSVDTSITSGPSGVVSSGTATFGFSASSSRSQFECRLDTGAWSACDSPQTYAGLGAGDHAFAVRATDRFGGTDPSPATRAWTVALPDVPIPPPPPAGTLMADGFDSANGANNLITNEYAAWHASDSTAVHSPVWRSDGGSLFSVSAPDAAGQTGRLAYTGALDSGFADKYSQAYTHSNKMRFWTKQSGLENIRIDADIKPTAWDPAVPSTWGGFKFYLRRQADATASAFYTVEPAINDGHIYIQKKCLGDTGGGNYSTEGTYYLLAQKSGYSVPLGGWLKIAAGVKTNSDGSVTISLYRNGSLLLQATDRGIRADGTGCPVLGPGRVGFRSDFLRYYLDNWIVSALP
jgi:hypothetical protein